MNVQFPSGVVAALAVASVASGTTIIDTTGSWPGARTAVWDHVGQEFEVPAIDNVLSTFELGVGGAEGVYSFSIYEWDDVDDHVVGGALFATGSLAVGVPDVEFVTFNVNLALTPGNFYAAVVSFDGNFYAAVVSFDGNPDGGVGRGVAFMSGNFYADGNAVFTEMPIDQPWDSGSPPSFDLAFGAVFVPAPGALALLGLAALMGTRRRREP